jgi:hypothetical protein
MLWAREDTTRYTVELTDGPQEVTVVFLGDFLVHGWSHWATFGHASTGGWATKEALFCLRDSYDLESERFLVSYLRHEARHFADYERYPALEQIDLEYRGKLTELVYARETRLDLLDTFTHHAARNPDAPHSWAADAVMRDLSREVFGEPFVRERERWAAVEPERIGGAARTLLARHDAELERAGAATTPGTVRDRPAP